jgi:hypothetical protein
MQNKQAKSLLSSHSAAWSVVSLWDLRHTSVNSLSNGSGFLLANAVRRQMVPESAVGYGIGRTFPVPVKPQCNLFMRFKTGKPQFRIRKLQNRKDPGDERISMLTIAFPDD